MSLSEMNAAAATGTRHRLEEVAPFSGICATCLDGCPGYCEAGKSAYRGREVMYPGPFGKVTAGGTKRYPVDFSHFNIQGTAVGALGVSPDSDAALFPNVDVEQVLGDKTKIKMRLPIFTGALGSTDIARTNWEGMAIGAAISGIIAVIGENVAGMDADAEIKEGRLVRSPELERRVKLFQQWYEGYGTVLVQCNVEDTRLGVLEYAINKLGVEAVEVKWGQGAKDIGGEVKLPSLERALELKRRGYLVIPDPEDPAAEEAYRSGAITEFERHSRMGMVEEDAFYQRVDELRAAGAKFISLKTGAYRPADLARAVKYCSNARLDLLTADGAGGGTGMSPWRMMMEWGIPTVYLESLLYDYAQRLQGKGAYLPSLAIGGGFTLEDQVFKGLALGAPYVKAVCMGRATMIPAMVGKTIGNAVAQGKVLPEWRKYGDTVEQIFVSAAKLKERYGKDFSRIPPAAIGMYTFCDRITAGLQQMMAGARKFALRYLGRDDLVALTREASRVSGIPYVMDADREEVTKILGA